MTPNEHAEALEKLIKLAYRPHYSCEEDSWYNCPKHPDGCADDRQPVGVCNCYADKHNAEVDKLAALLRNGS